MQEPYCKQITLGASTGISNLYTLLQAAAPANTTVRKVACELHLQADAAGAAAKYYVGNSDLTAGGGNEGVQLAASQALILGPLSSNLIHLDEIYLTSDSNGVKWNVIVITR